MQNAYKTLTFWLAPLIWLWLRFRLMKGKEDRSRFRERFGYTKLKRPAGTLLWLHAASVGEANSVLMLIERIRERFPQLQILLTTGTVTSARLMKKRLPKDIIHQYAPVDTPQATRRFIWHWLPDIALWVESEFWPNLVATADHYQCFMGVINARMSERSFASWKKYPHFIHGMLSRFDCMFAQSDADAARLKALGAKDVHSIGNIKYDAALLPCNESELLTLKNTIGVRPVWLAASTHPGEEALVAETHRLLAATRPTLLTIIVPRHPERGEAIAAELGAQFRVARRALKQPIAPDTQIYIADTLGELGLFYRLSERVFMGGSLVKQGGQNPLEPARLSCAIVSGTHTHNFADIYRDLKQANACAEVKNVQQLASQLDQWFNQPTALNQLQERARTFVEGKAGATAQLITLLSPLFARSKS